MAFFVSPSLLSQAVRCRADYSIYRGDQGDPDQSFELKLKNVHTALVKMDNIGVGEGGKGRCK